MNAQESTLVRQAQAGNAQAFGELYDAYARKIHDYLYFRTHHRETAEDLASKAFLKALEKLDSFDPDKGSFGSWLYRIAHNALVDHYRGQKPTEDIADVWDALRDHNADVSRDAEARMKLEQVQEHIAALPAAQREVVLLRVWDELSYAEIADLTGKSEAACKMAFSRASATLSKAFPLAMLLLAAVKP